MRTSKPIASAEAVAALRAAAARDLDPELNNPDYLARCFVTGPYKLALALPRGLTRPLLERMAPGSSSYILARTRFMDEKLVGALEARAEQVVILGAGYDTRAHRFESALRDVRVFEVDLPTTQRAKHERLQRSSVAHPENVVYVPHDFSAGLLQSTLESAGFERTRRSFFIWEGVCYYLKLPAVEETLNLVASSAPGSSIAFDYALQSFVDGDASTYGARHVQRWLARHGEPFHFGLAPGKLGACLSRVGLSAAEDLGPSELSDRYLTRDDGRKVGEPYGHLRLALAVNGAGAS